MTTEQNLEILEKLLKEVLSKDNKKSNDQQYFSLVNAITACRQQLAITELVEALKSDLLVINVYVKNE